MIWFDGPIESAVDKVKATNSPLLVFVQGEDDLSNAYDAYLRKETEFNESYIAIKISENSKCFQQFKEIYCTVPVPSVFLIGNNGMPLAILCSSEPSEITNIVKNVVTKQNVFDGKIDQNSNSQTKQISFAKGEENSFIKRNSNRKDNIARIQFRLPSNETCSWQFPDSCTLYDVKIYVIKTLKLGPKIKIFRTYPRIAFTKEDEEKTLKDLLLTPNAALIVVSGQDEDIQTKFSRVIIKKNIFFTFFMAIIQPIMTFINFLRNYISRNPGEQNLNVTSENRRPNKKPRSNIHGFTFYDKSDSDSDVNTDNGNSTVQK